MSNQKSLFLPVLLDRLTDDSPNLSSEVRRYGFNRKEYYNAVLRDLSWLLNTTQITPSLNAPFPVRVKNSTINYGLVSTSGRCFSDLDLPLIAAAIKEAIETFEPRVLPDSIVVKPYRSTSSESHNRALFEISAKLWFEPAPIDLLVRTEFDIESGHTTIISHADNPNRGG